MSVHVIVGAGPVGSATATLLADQGEQVTVVTRSGTGPEHPSVERVAADATDPDRLTALVDGAAVLYNCANPLYHRWLTDWPPLAAAVLTTAERTGVVLVTASNLYGCGPVDGPITADTPLAATHPKLKLRADLWRAALAAHEAGRVRVTEVRGSDYIEANSMFTAVLSKPLLAGARAYLPGKLDMPHSWTSIADMAAALVAVGADERAWGRAWLAPTNAPLTVREIATRFTEVAGAPAPRLSAISYPLLWTVGLFNPTVRELRAVYYQWSRPFTIDSRATTETFGLAPTPIDTALRALLPA